MLSYGCWFCDGDFYLSDYIAYCSFDIALKKIQKETLRLVSSKEWTPNSSGCEKLLNQNNAGMKTTPTTATTTKQI